MTVQPHCAACNRLMSDVADDNFTVHIIEQRGDGAELEHCSAACGLDTVRDFKPGPLFVYLGIGFDRYDLAIFQKALKGAA